MLNNTASAAGTVTGFSFRLGLALSTAVLASAGCGGGDVDLTVTRGALSYHLGRQDCVLHYTGIQGQPPVSIDLNCPVDLQPSSVRPALLLSVPLTTPVGAVPLLDPRYADPGYIPGHFLTVTYRPAGTAPGVPGQPITCDPTQATGSVNYLALPTVGSEQKQRLVGSFSADAALLSCNRATGKDPGEPLKLIGSFDLPTP